MASNGRVVDSEMGAGGQQRKLPANFKYNTYETKKTIAKGLLDVSLLMANAHQLKSVISYGDADDNYYPELFFIILSLLIQVAIGVILSIIGSLDAEMDENKVKLHFLNNLSVALVMAVTVANVFIIAFGVNFKDT